MACLHIDQCTFLFGERLVLTESRAPDPGARSVAALFVVEHPLQNKDFFTPWMHMGIETGVGCPPHQGRIHGLKLMQRHDGQARHEARIPIGPLGVDPQAGLVFRIELTQFDQQRAARHRKGLVGAVRGVSDVGALRVVALLIREGATQDEYFFAPIVNMPAKLGIGLVANHGGCASHLLTHPVEGFSLNARHGRVNPGQLGGVYNHPLIEVGVDVHVSFQVGHQGKAE